MTWGRRIHSRWGSYVFFRTHAQHGQRTSTLPGVMFQNLGGIGGAAASASLPGPMGPTGAASKALSFHIIALSTFESSVLIWVGSGCRICGRGGRGECSGSDNGASAEIQWSMQCDVNSGSCACIARIRSGFANHLLLSAYCPAVFGEPSRYPPQIGHRSRPALTGSFF